MVRYKYRYLVLSLHYGETHAVDTSVDADMLERRIRSTTETLFGPHGLGLIQSNLSVKYFSGFTGIGIVRVGRDFYRTLWSTLTFLNSINNRRCRVIVIHCSGTIRKAQEAALKYDRIQLNLALEQLQTKGKDANVPHGLLGQIGEENASQIQNLVAP